jgi:pimeloyl-ACP methyl ester carboxylesterase
LHQYLQEEAIFPGIYTGPRPFEWSGYFSFRNWLGGGSVDWNRTQAGSHLAWWAERSLSGAPDLIGHSYGGSISMLATSVEKECRGLLLLSPAVHETCLPDDRFYERILTIRMRFDLVLLADRSRPDLLARKPRVEERIVPRDGWLGHAATHDPDVWRANGLGEYIRDEWLPSLSPRA